MSRSARTRAEGWHRSPARFRDLALLAFYASAGQPIAFAALDRAVATLAAFSSKVLIGGLPVFWDPVVGDGLPIANPQVLATAGTPWAVLAGPDPSVLIGGVPVVWGAQSGVCLPTG